MSTKAKQDINNKSIEKVYKYILNKHSCKCIHNHNKNKNDIIGKYYREDCKCKSFYCKIKCRDSILTKSEILYTQLPAFVIVSEEQRDLHGELGITTQKITNIEIEQRLQSFYNNLCSNLNTNSIKVKI